MLDIPRAGAETSLSVISSIAVVSIVSSSIRISGRTNQEWMASLIEVVSVRLIQQDILIEVIIIHPNVAMSRCGSLMLIRLMAKLCAAIG